MKKTKILGIGNSDKFNYLIIKKRKDFLEFINELFVAAEERFEIPIYKDIEGTKKRNIMKSLDNYESYLGDELNVFIFYGKTKVSITYQTSQARKKRIMKKLGELGNFIKPHSTKK